jgi:hypothetical protein
MNLRMIADGLHWMKANDIPNWIVLLFTAIVWPIVLFIWQRRTVNNVSGLEVRLSPGNIHINGQPHNAVSIDVINHTGAVVYVTGARIKSCSAHFPVPAAASRDIAEGSYHLAFIDPTGQFSQRELTLQTNQTSRTAIPVTSAFGQSFYTYRAPWYRRLVRAKKYFVLEYVAMVGKKRYSVRTLY